MKIDKPTYLIAELQGEIEDYVFHLRNKFNPDRISWPTDITIAGSSGIGTISEGQDLDFVIAEFADVLRKFSFTDVKFEHLKRFPDTGTYVLIPMRDKFDALHGAIKKTKVEFKSNPWPYNPHCTLCAMKENTQQLEAEFTGAAYPASATICNFSIYQPESNGGNRLHKF